MRGDYAACSGNLIVEYFSGPATITEAEDYPWGDIDGIATGISFYHSAVRMAEITDGTTSTYLLGEKYLNPDSYTDGSDPADNEDLYSGFNNDNHRIAYYDPVTKTALTPRQDYPGLRSPRSFGSAHAGSADYPTRSLQAWKEIVEKFRPYVFRKPGEKIRPPDDFISQTGLPNRKHESKK